MIIIILFHLEMSRKWQKPHHFTKVQWKIYSESTAEQLNLAN